MIAKLQVCSQKAWRRLLIDQKQNKSSYISKRFPNKNLKLEIGSDKFQEFYLEVCISIIEDLWQWIPFHNIWANPCVLNTPHPPQKKSNPLLTSPFFSLLLFFLHILQALSSVHEEKEKKTSHFLWEDWDNHFFFLANTLVCFN